MIRKYWETGEIENKGTIMNINKDKRWYSENTNNIKQTP